MDSSGTTTLWRFVRGDLSIPDFETWLYVQDNLESELGHDLYMEVISFDYRDQRELFALRQKIANFLRPELKCECLTLTDMAVVPMGCGGQDERVFATVRQISKYGSSKWWLDLEQCVVCDQYWMVAQEERIYDDYFLKRLAAPEAQEILDTNTWPDDFSTYEKVLALGTRLSSACRFVDDFSPDLVRAARDLKRDRPNISIEEIGELLGVGVDHASALLSKI